MLDHVGYFVSNFARSKMFYIAALKPLGYGLSVDFGQAGLFGQPGKESYLWLGEGGTPQRCHFAFTAPSRAAVDAFYQAALAAGGKDNGPPGIRANYHPNYYGAFVLDPDDHNVEAVCHAPG